MLVKKIDARWEPAENRGLKVGETIEKTDPRELIMQGLCVAVDGNGRELSTYELYGVLEGKEKDDFQQWLDMKKAKDLQSKLTEEAETLKKEVAEVKAEEVKTEVKVTKKGGK